MDYVPKYIIVHHSAAEKPDPQFESINQWHKARGFAVSELGYYVGYHLVIEKDGTKRRARNDLERDCDALGHNFDSLSVCLAGNLNISKPTTAQEIALADLLAYWCREYKMPYTEIKPHRAVGQTSCYGTNVPDSWAAYITLQHEIECLRKIQDGLKV